MGVIFSKRLVTLELAGRTEKQRNHKAYDKNINPLGSELKVDNVLVFTRVLKAADYECFLYKIPFSFLIRCIFKRVKHSLGFLAVRGFPSPL